MKKDLLMPRFFFTTAILLSLQGCSYVNSVEGMSSFTPKELYSIAQYNLMDGNYNEATKYYEYLTGSFPDLPVSIKGDIELAYSYYKNDDPDQALAVCERFLSIYPEDVNSDYMLYLKSLILYKRNQYKIAGILGHTSPDRDPKSLSDSLTAFRELLTRYPNSKLAESAKRYVERIDFMLSKHDMDIAIFYMQHKAYAAALSRFKDVLINHPYSHLRKEVLTLMIGCYKEIGMDKLAADTLEVLHKNYPEHKHTN